MSKGQKGCFTNLEVPNFEGEQGVCFAREETSSERSGTTVKIGEQVSSKFKSGASSVGTPPF